MTDPRQTLELILAQSDALLAGHDGPLNPQQQTFVRHIQQTARQLHRMVADVPPTQRAQREIFPVMGDDFVQPQVALFGYARMLLQHPESFGGATPTPQQRDRLRAIDEAASGLYRLTTQLNEDATAERLSQRQAAPTRFDLSADLTGYLPVLRYWLRGQPVQLSVDIQPDVMVYAQAYHVREAIRHILYVMAYERVNYGRLALNVQIHDADFAEVRIFCTGIRLDDDDMRALFGQDGRHIYHRQILKQGGELRVRREPGVGSTLAFTLPRHTPE